MDETQAAEQRPKSRIQAGGARAAERRRGYAVAVECRRLGLDRAWRHLGSLAERHGLVMSGPLDGDADGVWIALRVPGARTAHEALDFVAALLERFGVDAGPFRIVG